MAKDNKPLLNSAVLSIIIFCCGCSSVVAGRSCKSLEVLFEEQPDLETKLIDWVDENTLHILEANEYWYRTITRVPGDFEVKNVEFDWEWLGFDKKLGRLMLITKNFPKAGEVSLEDLEYVSFSDQSRISILVSPKENESSRIPEKYLRHVSNRVAIYCDK